MTTPNTSQTDSNPPPHTTCIHCAYVSLWDCSCIWQHPMPQGYDTPATSCPDFEPEILAAPNS